MEVRARGVFWFCWDSLGSDGPLVRHLAWLAGGLAWLTGSLAWLTGALAWLTGALAWLTGSPATSVSGTVLPST